DRGRFLSDARRGIPSWLAGAAARAGFRSVDLREPWHYAGDFGPSYVGHPASFRALGSGPDRTSDPHAGMRFDAHAVLAPFSCGFGNYVLGSSHRVIPSRTHR